QFKSFGPFYRNGEVVNAPQLFHYAAGTTTLKDSYLDRQKISSGPQPINGDANGLITGYFDGVYKIKVTLADGVTELFTWDQYDITEGIHTLRGSALMGDIDVDNTELYISPFIPIPGAVPGNQVLASCPAGALNGLQVTAYVVFANNVQFTVYNVTGANLTVAATTWNFLIFQSQ